MRTNHDYTSPEETTGTDRETGETVPVLLYGMPSYEAMAASKQVASMLGLAKGDFRSKLDALLMNVATMVIGPPTTAYGATDEERLAYLDNRLSEMVSMVEEARKAEKADVDGLLSAIKEALGIKPTGLRHSEIADVPPLLADTQAEMDAANEALRSAIDDFKAKRKEGGITTPPTADELRAVVQAVNPSVDVYEVSNGFVIGGKRAVN